MSDWEAPASRLPSRHRWVPRHIAHQLEGWLLLRTLILVVTASSLATLTIYPFDVSAVRAVIRVTARTSLLLFLAAFLASALHSMRSSRFTAWLRRNRRQLGLGFAYSHFVHAIAIIAFWQLDPVTFLAGRTPGSYIPGALGYAFIVAMAITSFDWTARTVGPRAWTLIHRIGVWYVFIQFCLSFGKRVVTTPGYAGFLLVLLLALGVRSAAFITRFCDRRLPRRELRTEVVVAAVRP